MKVHLQHVFGFGGSLTLLACLIYAKPAFLLDSSIDSASLNEAGCFEHASYALGIGAR